MRKFLLKTGLFAACFGLILLGCLLAPPTPQIRVSAVYGKLVKDSLLRAVPGPRLVLLGGSNLPFGLNGEAIQAATGLNVVNTGIMQPIGLKAMLKHYLPFRRPGDIVVVSPEYTHFFGDYLNGGRSLLYFNTVDHFNPLYDLDAEQRRAVRPYLLRVILSKLDPREYFGYHRSKFFRADSFNEYGDLREHWNMPREEVPAAPLIEEPFNPDAVRLLTDFRRELAASGILLYLAPPAYQQSSAEVNAARIAQVCRALTTTGIPLLGRCEEYVLPDSLFFNSPYHLTEIGTHRRTQMFVRDLRAHWPKAQ